MWADLPDTWAVYLIDLAGDVTTRHWNITDGVGAIISAQRMHKDPDRGGRVYVMTPKGSAYLVQDNGLTRVGF